MSLRRLPGLVAVILALFAASRLAAQSTLAELGRASELMQAADKAFRDPAKERRGNKALDDGYREIGELISIFVRTAPASRIDDALEAAYKSYDSLHLPKPDTLAAVAVDCDKRRDPTLASRLATILWLKFSLARENAEAEAKLGPLPDNPAFYAAIQPPGKAVDLLTNLKWILDHDALVREDFFVPSPLHKVLGVDVGVQRFVNGNVSTFAIARSDGQFCSYQANRYVRAAGKASGFIDIRCTYRRDGMPTFEDVERVFGKQWLNGRVMRPPSPHAPPPPAATAPHGNQVIAYDFSAAGMKRTLGVSFAADASFAQLHMTTEGQ